MRKTTIFIILIAFCLLYQISADVKYEKKIFQRLPKRPKLKRFSVLEAHVKLGHRNSNRGVDKWNALDIMDYFQKLFVSEQNVKPVGVNNKQWWSIKYGK